MLFSVKHRGIEVVDSRLGSYFNPNLAFTWAVIFCAEEPV
jgi:hypothetical protein